MKTFNQTLVFFIFLACFALAHSELVQNFDFEELSRDEIAYLKKTNFFKRILQES